MGFTGLIYITLLLGFTGLIYITLLLGFTGLVAEAVLDESLERSLLLLFQAGMFDPLAMQPYTKIPFETIGSPAHHALALDAARQDQFQLLHPAPPYQPFPRGKRHTRGNIWSFTVGWHECCNPTGGVGALCNIPCQARRPHVDQIKEFGGALKLPC